MKKEKAIRVIISGGGTGGHIYPAISIANAIKELDSEAEILFVGALGKMEMEKVPAAGYSIIGLPISGLQRSLSLRNLSFPFKLVASLLKAGRIIRQFNPSVAVGVGGYASGALLWMATRKKIPALIQEQNSYPGITNKLLKDKADKICVAYPNMERFFPKDKILLTGNPVRKDLLEVEKRRAEAFEFFKIPTDHQVLLILGGSLGAGTLNRAVLHHLDQLKKDKLSVIWQCGKYYLQSMQSEMQKHPMPHLQLKDFISRMDLAYAASDVIISRAGAGTISELCLVGKPVILVPSPNVAEDHQTQNALALVNENAAKMIRDAEAVETLIPAALNLLDLHEEKAGLSQNILRLALPDAALTIAKETLHLAERHINIR